jgi:hypothetical protein
MVASPHFVLRQCLAGRREAAGVYGLSAEFDKLAAADFERHMHAVHTSHERHRLS